VLERIFDSKDPSKANGYLRQHQRQGGVIDNGVVPSSVDPFPVRVSFEIGPYSVSRGLEYGFFDGGICLSSGEVGVSIGREFYHQGNSMHHHQGHSSKPPVTASADPDARQTSGCRTRDSKTPGCPLARF
jgi:hypothetical protein